MSRHDDALLGLPGDGRDLLSIEAHFKEGTKATFIAGELGAYGMESIVKILMHIEESDFEVFPGNIFRRKLDAFDYLFQFFFHFLFGMSVDEEQSLSDIFNLFLLLQAIPEFKL